MSVYYFVVYETRVKAGVDPKVQVTGKVSNVIIKDWHPLMWCTQPKPDYDKFFITYLHFWAEITEEIALAVESRHYISIESPGTVT